ncbi:efflux RND transporter permease subunit [Thioalkalivibrio sp. HK1]|uniref:efflux RND transporter permease subunit n=1 Tax=Thioalkalivibrio sp. HK1 TaxID=1469245 RepID=UPI0004B31692|nr:efflux RND transporter permease subunit [Thioalkalivibrio sp. HK1]
MKENPMDKANPVVDTGREHAGLEAVPSESIPPSIEVQAGSATGVVIEGQTVPHPALEDRSQAKDSHSPPPERVGVLQAFARHPVACNLLMVVMLLIGAYSLVQLNKQFFPEFSIDFIIVTTSWPGASAEDVEAAITDPIESELLGLGSLRRVTSNSKQGSSVIRLEYEEGSDMAFALDEVNERIGSLSNLPESAEKPTIKKIIPYEPIAKLLVVGDDRFALRPIVRRIERELLDRGISKIEIAGLPKEEIAIQVPTAALQELDLTLDDIARRVGNTSRDVPSGTIGITEASKQIRAIDQQRREFDFEHLPLQAQDDRLLILGDIATVERRSRKSQTRITYEGRPAISLILNRAQGTDTLEMAGILNDWLDSQAGRFPPGVEVFTYEEDYELVVSRMNLLLKNGLGGLILVLAMLFLLLKLRVAFWVAVGIPISFMATLGVLLALGGSINMISMFALIMALGIIVDDAIVVGEDALTWRQAGASPLAAAEAGAKRMFVPVICSSLTTIAAFLPLMLVGGIIGTILFAIPLVVICVIIASVIESFLILPGHLHHSFAKEERKSLRRTGQSVKKKSVVRHGLDQGFLRLRDKIFRPLVTRAVARPIATLCCAISALLLVIGLLAGGRVPFSFFPTPEGRIVYGDVKFVAGTSSQEVERYMALLDASLREAEAAFDEQVVERAITTLGRTAPGGDGVFATGDHLANLQVQMIDPELRIVRNADFVRTWQEMIEMPPAIDSISVYERLGGPPGRDIDISLVGPDIDVLKASAQDLAGVLRTMSGVIDIGDNLPFGKEQLIIRLTPQADAVGLTVADVGAQLRAAYNGHVAQVFQDAGEDIEVRVILPDDERNDLASIERFVLQLPGGGTMPLLTAVDLESRRGFDLLRHRNGQLAVQVTASVDKSVNNANAVYAELEAGPLQDIVDRYGVEWSVEGLQAEQLRTIEDMLWGAGLAIALIYLILAFVFASYGWPLVVMSTIPFGLVGAIAGHWLMGIDLTILSIFGLFALSGIVVNDSIILVTFYKELKEQGMPWREAIVEAACRRLRAVLLTSLTTIGGLTPLMFETSTQAQFLIPMAATITFGLALATFLVLFLVPALLCLHEAMAEGWKRLSQASERPTAPQSTMPTPTEATT